MNTVLIAQSIGQTFQQTAASGPLLLALGACVLAGLVSFASPCVVPLVPGYLAYMASIVGAERPAVTVQAAEQRRAEASTLTLEQQRQRVSSRRRVVLAAVLFVAGFTVVFVLLSAMVLGTVQYLAPQQELLQRLGGVVTILMGLVFIGAIPALQRDTRMQPKALSTWAARRYLAPSSPWDGRRVSDRRWQRRCRWPPEPDSTPHAEYCSSWRTAWGSDCLLSWWPSVRREPSARWAGCNDTRERFRSSAASCSLSSESCCSAAYGRSSCTGSATSPSQTPLCRSDSAPMVSPNSSRVCSKRTLIGS